jgi:DNA replication protein DnaC
LTKSSAEDWVKRELAHLDERISVNARFANASKISLPKRFGHCTSIKALGWVLERNKPAADTCVAFCENPSTAPAPFLMGPSGCGKTHLLWATASDLYAKQVERLGKWATATREAGEKQVAVGQHATLTAPGRILIEITNGAEVAHELRSSVKDDSIDATVNSFRQIEKRSDGMPSFSAPSPDTTGPACKILMIDDIEIMKMGDWLAEELYRIVDYRYAENMPTMFVSNLAPEELRNHLGDRIARRMLDMTKPVVMR